MGIWRYGASSPSAAVRNIFRSLTKTFSRRGIYMTDKIETKNASEEKGIGENAPDPAPKRRGRKPRAKSAPKEASYEVDEESSIRSESRDGRRKNILIMEMRKSPSGYSSLYFTPEGCDYISKLAGFGATIEEICDDIGVSVPTAQNKNNKDMFMKAYQKGKSEFFRNIRINQSTIMRRGSASMAMFLGKNYLGQRDNPKDEVILDANSPLGQFVLQIGAQQKKSAEKDLDDETEKATE